MDTGKNSLLRTCFPDYDYTDSFRYVITDPEDKIGIVQIAETFLRPKPKWLDGLFAVRNIIAAPFGLRTPATISKSNDCCDKWEPGMHAGIFGVFARSENEIILGEDDKHLDLRISLFLERRDDKKQITVTTVVKRHNLLGKCYFFFIKPFHKMIVPCFLKRNFRRLASGLPE